MKRPREKHEFQILEWNFRDSGKYDERKCAVTCYGCDADGDTCAFTFNFKPYFFVKSDLCVGAGELQSALETELDARVECSEHYAKPFTRGTVWDPCEGILPDELFFRLTFDNVRSYFLAGNFFNGKPARKAPDWFKLSCSNGDWKLYDFKKSNVLMKAMHAHKLKSTGWIAVDVGLENPPDRRVTSCVRDFSCEEEALTEDHARALDREDVAPFCIGSWDIEAFSARSTAEEPCFPDPDQPEDVVTQIVFFFHRYGRSKPFAAHMWMLDHKKNATDAMAEDFCRKMREKIGAETAFFCHRFATEREMLAHWIKKMKELQPTVWSGFNTLGFDEEYVWKRCEKRGLHEELQTLSFDSRVEVKLDEIQMESKAYGHNVYKIIKLPGVFHLDSFFDIRKNYKMDSYGLAECAKEFLKGEEKIDLKPQEQFDLYREGASEGLFTILEYCVQDVNVTFELELKLSIFSGMLSAANVTWVPITWIGTRGQQCRVYSLIRETLVNGRGEKYLMVEDCSQFEIEGKFQGATVLPPKVGFYEDPVATLDFASLYPSCMKEKNTSHETLLVMSEQDPKGPKKFVLASLKWSEERGAQLSFVFVEQFDIPCMQGEIEEEDDDEEMHRESDSEDQDATVFEKMKRASLKRKREDAVVEKKMKRVTFATEKQFKGVLPEILEMLKVQRKMYKKEMGKYEKLAHEEPDPAKAASYRFLESVFDAKQKAVKVTMNSVYGFTGVMRNGMQPCVEIASTTTSEGRRLIDVTEEFCKGYLPGSEIVYGDTDSVFWRLFPGYDAKNDPDVVKKAFDIAFAACESIQKVFLGDRDKTYIELEFENVYWPLNLIGKKMYSYTVYSADLGPHKSKKLLDAKGIRMVRRDTVAHTKNSQKKVLEKLHSLDRKGAVEFAKSAGQALLDGRVSVEDLIMSKKMNSRYKVTAVQNDGSKMKVEVTPFGKWTGNFVSGTCKVVGGKPWVMYDEEGREWGTLTLTAPHVHVAVKMEERVPGSRPRIGDRVPYVFVHDKNPKALQIEKAEDPAYAKENGLRLDAEYYFEKTLKNPICDVMKAVDPKLYDSIFAKAHKLKKAEDKGIRSVASFFKKI